MPTRLKTADVITPLQPHQQRVVDRISSPDQPGLVVAHGLGSGKTLSSIAAAESLGLPTAVLVPSSLRANYEKELAKHVTDPAATYDISSLQRAARAGVVPEGDFLIVDEAHRLRDPSTKSNKAVAAAEAKKRLLLTGTPLYNRPTDLAALVNLAAGERVLPVSPGEFANKYLGEKTVDPGWFARNFKGITPGTVPFVKNKKELKQKLRQWVDYHENALEGFPERRETVIETEMGPKQRAIYKSVLGTAPAWLRYKIENKLPLTKQESKDLNAFANAVRQVAVSPGGFDVTLDSLGAARHSPKLQQAFNNFNQALQANPNHKAVIYSNYLNAGLRPYAALLDQAGIPYGQFTGEMKKSERDQMVKDFNNNKIKALLVSSAGGEGLDLKGTRQIQVLDPHWNKEKLEQVIGRGIRYKSHEHLPEDQRNVAVEHYVSVNEKPGMLRKLLGEKRPGSIDEYLRQLSAEKDLVNTQIRNLLLDKREEPMRKAASHSVDSDNHRMGVSDALRSLGMHTPRRVKELHEREASGSTDPLTLSMLADYGIKSAKDHAHPDDREVLERHLDDIGIALMASPIAGELVSSGLEAVPYKPISSTGTALRNFIGKESPWGHSNLRELLGLALVAPSVTHAIADKFTPTDETSAS
jgi:superfamily II DNA or RNA helicase